ncbi:hypothetical protein P280DRAFT_519639 [Massarina eburnea CBS 473.64]|uniref:Uncharacterized protein n=1 Tax=Massarina eburnea CBS 473.64 TaxID=1395130 RepID=A0A6A6RTT2_9PLEO|nr:hypothetical protein P280DRAFT_519639 [Massarina eburnea CBS 473.64]
MFLGSGGSGSFGGPGGPGGPGRGGGPPRKGGRDKVDNSGLPDKSVLVKAKSPNDEEPGYLAEDWRASSLTTFLRAYYPPDQERNPNYDYEPEIREASRIIEAMEQYETSESVQQLVQTIMDLGEDRYNQRPFAHDRHLLMLILYRHYRYTGGFSLPPLLEAREARMNARARQINVTPWPQGRPVHPREIVDSGPRGTSFQRVNAPGNVLGQPSPVFRGLPSPSRFGAVGDPLSGGRGGGGGSRGGLGGGRGGGRGGHSDNGSRWSQWPMEEDW